MNKLHLHLFAFFIFIITPLSSQTSAVSFATWKDNKKAAYTIIHDDFSSHVPGIYQYADPIATARGIKLCFGAITNACTETEWAQARTMMTHGHECVNHSHNHKCGGTTSQCTGLPRYTSKQFVTELKLSTELIETNTGVRPRFFIHPYDASTPAILNYLKTIGYLGTRAGTQGIVNSSSFTNFMNLNYHVYDGSAASLATLNPAVNSAIASGGYAVREFHGVADGSWGVISVEDYTDHLNYVQTKINEGVLWSATATEVLSYKMQRDAFNPVADYNVTAGAITIIFNKLKTINTAALRTSVTLNVDVTNSSGTFTATQNGLDVPVIRNGNTLSVNIYPHQGKVIFRGAVALPPPPPACIKNGKVAHQVWSNLVVNTYSIEDLKTDTRFPNTPSSTDTIAELSQGDLGDAYGEKTFGYLVPPTTGNYTFYITGDDDTELYLSLTGDPADKTKICGFTGYTQPTEYAKYAGQKSATISLIAGKYYYFEALHIGTVGTHNHFNVYWTLPDMVEQGLIGSTVLSSKNCDLINNPPLAARSSEYFDFAGRLLENKAVLSWAAKFSDGKDYFVLEKINDKTGDFEQVDIINATTTGQSVDYFTRTDADITEGDNFYRLKIVGQNTPLSVGTPTVQYSDLVTVHFERPNAYLLFPNPAHDYVDIDLSQATQGKSVEIAVMSLLGKVVYEQKIEKLGSAFYHISLESLENGQYFVRIQAEGKRVVMKKLMVLK